MTSVSQWMSGEMIMSRIDSKSLSSYLALTALRAPGGRIQGAMTKAYPGRYVEEERRRKRPPAAATRRDGPTCVASLCRSSSACRSVGTPSSSLRALLASRPVAAAGDDRIGSKR